MNIVWGSVPAEQQTINNTQEQQVPSGRSGGSYGYPFGDDFFNYFFGNGFGR